MSLPYVAALFSLKGAVVVLLVLSFWRAYNK